MYLYKNKPQFNRDTGEPINPILYKCGAICDYTGTAFDLSDYDQKPLYHCQFEYDDDSEPLWYEDKERRILEKSYCIGYREYSQFMSSPYHFQNTEGFGSTDASRDLVAIWLDSVKYNENSPFHECGTIEQAFRKSRLRILMRMLDEKKYTPQDFGFLCEGE